MAANEELQAVINKQNELIKDLTSRINNIEKKEHVKDLTSRIDNIEKKEHVKGTRQVKRTQEVIDMLEKEIGFTADMMPFDGDVYVKWDAKDDKAVNIVIPEKRNKKTGEVSPTKGTDIPVKMKIEGRSDPDTFVETSGPKYVIFNTLRNRAKYDPNRGYIDGWKDKIETLSIQRFAVMVTGKECMGENRKKKPSRYIWKKITEVRK